jgi:CheY-like chemotaxis protein
MTTVLVVDDSPSDRRIAELVLQEEVGVRVVCAQDGAEALELIQNETPDAIVTDFRMPSTDGLQVVDAVRASHPTVPVVLMTGMGNEDIAAEALRRGAASYVPKRNLTRDLGHTIKTVLAASAPSRDLRHLISCTTHLEMRYVLESDPGFIHPLVKQMQAYLIPLGICDQSSCMQTGIALAEALQNAIYHGNLELESELREQGEAKYVELAETRRFEPPYNGRRVEFTAKLSGEEALYVITDDGDGFNPRGIPDPREPENLRKASGRGLLLIRTFMDEVRHSDKGNQITMIKRPAAGV